jgi:glycosyltransferase involved in cell wall biosynthesis
LTAAIRWEVSNPIDPEFFAIPPTTQPGLRILCVGTVSERKNQALLVEACRRLARAGVNFEARIVGPMRDGSAYVDRLRASLAEKELGGRVKLTGPVSQAEMLGHYAWASTVVLPSFEESSSLALMQAMAAQRCAFGARSAALPEVLADGRLGTLFSPLDAGELAAALQEFDRSPAAALARAAVAAGHARETFPAEAVARRTLAVYESILNRPLHPGGMEEK